MLLSLALLVGCESGPKPIPALERFELVVPVDRAAPDGPTTTVQAGRIPSFDDEPLGPLAFNFGGPGAAAVASLPAVAEAFPELLEHFDLVAVDPRLTDDFSPLVDCMPGYDDILALEFDATDGPALDAHRAARAAWLGDCLDVAGDVAGHLGVRDLVADHEALRVELGGAPITFVGFSWGTAVGQVYADEHPGGLRALYLDGVTRPAGAYVDFVADQTLGFQASFDEFVAWCPTAPTDCPLDDPAQTVTGLFDELRKGPIAGESGRDLTYGRAWNAVTGALYGPSAWPVLASALVMLEQGDPERMVALGDAFVGRDQQGDWSPLFAGYTLTECQDLALPADEDELFAAVEAARAESPLFGPGLLLEALTCMAAEAPNDPVPGPIVAEGAPPILLVGGEHDPATPYEVAVDVHDTLADSTLLTWTGTGHVAFFASSCVSDAGLDFLVDLTPPSMLRCD